MNFDHSIEALKWAALHMKAIMENKPLKAPAEVRRARMRPIKQSPCWACRRTAFGELGACHWKTGLVIALSRYMPAGPDSLDEIEDLIESFVGLTGCKAQKLEDDP
jgi:hypothetical protein